MNNDISCKKGTKALADILALRNTHGRYGHIIARCLNDGYNDFKFDRVPGHPKYAEDICPKVVLMDHLCAFPELKDLAERVYKGEFDDVADDDDLLAIGMDMVQDHPDENLDFIFRSMKMPYSTEYYKKLINKSRHN